jgi:predicted ATPase/DNA-binding SARP family transcriptional activator
VPRLALSFLGSIAITLDGQPVTGFDSGKVRGLLAYLAAEAGSAHSRDALVGMFWPELPERAARSNLSQALANLRQVISDRTAQPPFLLIDSDTIQFNRQSDHWLDLSQFEELLAACDSHVHRARDRCHACLRRMEEAADLYRDDFLDHFSAGNSAGFEEWVVVRRERLQQLALGVLSRLAGYQHRLAQHEQALGYARRQLEIDPWREEAHRQAMRALALSGERTAALEQYERCRQILRDELHAEPTQGTTALVEWIRAGPAAGEAPQPAGQRLPTPQTTLVGRVAEIAELGARIENPNCRLITLVGPGGIGKTRLALAVAAAETDTFMQGARYVALDALSSPGGLPEAILQALDVPLPKQVDPKTQLLATLRGQELLLVLDNFEHLLEGVGLLTEILLAAPRVILLVTSRERLNLQAEWVFDLQGLNYPTEAADIGAMTSEAVQLFIQRAGQASRHFNAAKHIRAVAGVCRLVQGLPLAIELAAAATAQQSPEQVMAALETDLRALVTTMRDMPVRHRSLTAVVDHSWTLLTDAERGVQRRLSVFRGGFTLEAAAEVAGATLPLLTALLQKSLIARDTTGRYAMHPIIRQHAAGKLEAAGELAHTFDQALGYFLALAEAGESNFVRLRPPAWMDRMAAEQDNLRAVLGWCQAQNRVEAWLRLAALLWNFWESRGQFVEGLAWLEAALRRNTELASEPQSGTMAAARAKALHAVSNLARRRHDFARAISSAEEALDFFRPLEDPWATADVVNILGRSVRDSGDLERAKPLLEESLQLYRTLGDATCVAYGIGTLAILAQMQGDSVRASALAKESLAMCRMQGNRWGCALQLEIVGHAALSRGEYLEAISIFEESLALFEETDFMPGRASALFSLGEIKRAQGDRLGARAYFEAALALQRAMVNTQGIGQLLVELEQLAEQNGEQVLVSEATG